MPRTDRLYLVDIIEAIDALSRFVTGISIDDLVSDDLIASAVLQKLIVIGEAASRLSLSTRKSHPEIPWERVIGMRNVAVHAYFSIDWSIIWTTAKENLPILREQVTNVLDHESRAEGP
jgi:uncharacterized protein with HEPN domain